MSVKPLPKVIPRPSTMGYHPTEDEWRVIEPILHTLPRVQRQGGPAIKSTFLKEAVRAFIESPDSQLGPLLEEDRAAVRAYRKIADAEPELWARVSALLAYAADDSGTRAFLTAFSDLALRMKGGSVEERSHVVPRVAQQAPGRKGRAKS